jgi:hypothetical protein
MQSWPSQRCPIQAEFFKGVDIEFGIAIPVLALQVIQLDIAFDFVVVATHDLRGEEAALDYAVPW